jgi:hypothetical protein
VVKLLAPLLELVGRREAKVADAVLATKVVGLGRVSVVTRDTRMTGSYAVPSNDGTNETDEEPAFYYLVLGRKLAAERPSIAAPLSRAAISAYGHCAQDHSTSASPPAQAAS